MHRLNHVTFHLTNQCNLSCRHCWVNAGRSYINNIEELSIENWINIIDQCKNFNVSVIRFTGGEPLVKKDVDELFRYCNKVSMPFQIETNGLLLDDARVQLIKECGIRFVSVSLDSPTCDFHDYFRNKIGAFNRALGAIELLHKHNIPFQVIMCVCKENLNDVPDMVKLCENYNMVSLKINPVNDNETIDDSITILSIKDILNLNDQIRNLRKQTKLRIVYPMPYAFSTLKELVESTPFGCDICNRLAIMPDGKVSICGVGISAPEMIVGDISKDKLSRIWEDAGFLKTLEKDIPDKLEGVCRICIHKKDCRGYCRAFPILQTHNLFAPYHICQRAFEEGLFPTNRLIKTNDEK